MKDNQVVKSKERLRKTRLVCLDWWYRMEWSGTGDDIWIWVTTSNYNET
jgi:hypothetical protein